MAVGAVSRLSEELLHELVAFAFHKGVLSLVYGSLPTSTSSGVLGKGLYVFRSSVSLVI